MSNLVLIPKNADVTEREAKEAILALIDVRIHSIQTAIYLSAGRVQQKLQSITIANAPSPDEITRAMQEIRTDVEDMAKLLDALTARYDARSVQLRDIEQPDADDPFADPPLIQQAS